MHADAITHDIKLWARLTNNGAAVAAEAAVARDMMTRDVSAFQRSYRFPFSMRRDMLRSSAQARRL